MRDAIIQPTTTGNNFIPSCLPEILGQPRLAMWGFLAVVIFDIILVIMAIGAKIKFGYSLNANSLTKKVYQDAVYYFVLNFLISITSVMIYDKCPGPLKELTGIFPSIATPCLSCRLILRLRNSNETGMTTMATDNPIQFGQNPFLRSEGSSLEPVQASCDRLRASTVRTQGEA
ncbi:hypothetical protein P691DRAFT_778497 [Macrolepiota fuliginosa MF-IS2]|uniref:Uncharacterized protein n=1 Tax=Macrolepiota fuliginosa MF-IS2 TaxID=1400762 RepID=A0A9P5X4X7_9AGAR|nr:hypothetical protein P691DRAFT_778497 [Macrolepiota fuliginosa MF-IS2]